MNRRNCRDTETEEGVLTEEAMAQYEKLVQEVRMRQHELGNQLSVVKNITSDDAGRYLEELNKDQRHNVLLLCGDPLLAGLLYQKCTTAEGQGIQMENHISTRIQGYALPQHDLIAITGVLLDNAIEAELTRPQQERYIRIVVDEEYGRYRIMVANRFPYVPYGTMGKWFEEGHSSKGSGRGLGLAHVRRLCAENSADIAYGNQEVDGENEVFFMLYLDKAEEKAKEGSFSEGSHKAAAETGNGSHRSLESIAEKRLWQVDWFRTAGVVLGILAVAGLVLFLNRKLEAKRQERSLAEKLDISHTREVAAAAVETELAQTVIPRTAVLGKSRPYLLYDEQHLPEDGSSMLIDLPKAVSWNADAVELATVSYEIYDAQGHRVGRDTYVAADMDTLQDKGKMVKRGQKLYFPDGEYYRRMQEHWEYDGAGREASYQKYKQYGETLEPELVLMEFYTYDATASHTMTIEVSEDRAAEVKDTNSQNTDGTIRIIDKNSSEQPLREYEIDSSGNILWLTDYTYDRSGYPLSGSDGIWVWNEAHRQAHVTDTDYYGEVYEFIFDYDAAGHKTDGYYAQDGMYYRGYEAVYDEMGRIIEEYDNMPIVRKERLPDLYQNNFYDAEHTKPLQPPKTINHYRYHLYDSDGKETDLLDLDVEYGYGDLYVYCYDETGALAITYDYRIWANQLQNFTLDTPARERLYFDSGNYEYSYYEEYGSIGTTLRNYLTEVSLEDVSGKMVWIFTFDREGPQMRRFADGNTVDWTVPMESVAIQ